MSVENNLLKSPNTFKPMKYPEAFEFWKEHDKMVWHFDEVPMEADIMDFKKADKAEKEFITELMRLFTQNDIEVGDGYDVLLRIFKPTEVKMMLRGNSDRENTHIGAYSHFTESLGFPDEFYSEFLKVPEMKDKVNYIRKAKVKKYEQYQKEYFWKLKFFTRESMNGYISRRYRQDIIRMLAVYATVTEGISLFAQFAMLLKYQLLGKYKGLCTLVEWSIKDEEKHVEGNSWLLREFIKENKDVFNDEVKKDVYEAVRQIVDKEERLIDLLNPPHLDKTEIKRYVRYIADQRLKQIGFKPNWNIEKNPFKFMEEVTGTVLSNFISGQKSTEYTKSAMTGSWEDVRKELESSIGS